FQQVRGYRLRGRMPERKKGFLNKVSIATSPGSSSSRKDAREKKMKKLIFKKFVNFNRSGVTVFEDGCPREKDEKLFLLKISQFQQVWGHRLRGRMPERKKGLFKKSPLLQVRGHRLRGRMPEKKKKKNYLKSLLCNRSGVIVFEEECQREKDEKINF
ncbi:MAG: hypothetical protein ACRC2N_03760, partial [Aeromonas sp.]